MVVFDAPPQPEPAPLPPSVAPAALEAYVVDMTGQLAALCITAGRPQVARLLLEAVIALKRDQPPANAAEGDAA